MYPLGRDYIPEIKDFIDRIRQHPEIEVVVNGMSTQLFGDFRTLMQVVSDEMEASYQHPGKSVFVMKVVNSHLKT